MTLKGSGNRRDENGADVSLDDHIGDVVSLMNDSDLHNVTLVGHSYGGRVITGVTARIPGRIGHVVFIDAHAPVADDSGPSEERRECCRTFAVRRRARQCGEAARRASLRSGLGARPRPASIHTMQAHPPLLPRQ